ANAVIEPNTPRHIVHIGSHGIADIGHFIDKRDLHGQKSIGSIFNNLSRDDVSNDHGGFKKIQWTVEFLHDRQGMGVFAANHDAIGPHEILDGGAFTEEFRIGDHA